MPNIKCYELRAELSSVSFSRDCLVGRRDLLDNGTAAGGFRSGFRLWSDPFPRCRHERAFTYNYVKHSPEHAALHDLSASQSEAARSECVVHVKAASEANLQATNYPRHGSNTLQNGTQYQTHNSSFITHNSGENIIGRFLSPDPYIQAPYFAQNFDRYSYVWNNPLKYVDPSGYKSDITGWKIWPWNWGTRYSNRDYVSRDTPGWWSWGNWDDPFTSDAPWAFGLSSSGGGAGGGAPLGGSAASGPGSGGGGGGPANRATSRSNMGMRLRNNRPLATRGTPSAYSVGETASLYPTSNTTNPSISELYNPDKWDRNATTLLLEARAGIDYICTYRNNMNQKDNLDLTNPINRKVYPYHLKENFPEANINITNDENVCWYYIGPDPGYITTAIDQNYYDVEIVIVYGPFYNTYDSVLTPFGPTYIIFYRATPK